MTLEEIYIHKPEWRNLPIVIYTGGNGDYDYAPLVYVNDEIEEPVLVFDVT